ncbi:hypothetical protein ABT246_24835 [Streptomyces sp. NPDC001553]|uniref:hypothetical protein n=1 Tax=Streptomyces sp. NPDC001553 TaxID=3154385 RepID=UPI0033273A08
MGHEISPPSSLPEIAGPEILALEENGHRLALGDKPEAQVYFLAGHPQVSRVARRCAICDERPSYTVADKVLQVTNPCPYPDGFTTEITLSVPSGKLLVTDNLRPVYNWDDSTFASYNSALGQAQAIKAMAAAGCAYGPVGNSCPTLYRTGTDTYVIANIDEDGGEDAIPGDPETNTADFNERTRLAGIVTDLWAYSIADFEDWKSRGGDLGTLGWSDTIVDVAPGTYRFTHHTGERDFDRDGPWPLVFAHIQCIT